MEIRYPEFTKDGKTSGGSKLSLSAIGFLKNQYLTEKRKSGLSRFLSRLKSGDSLLPPAPSRCGAG